MEYVLLSDKVIFDLPPEDKPLFDYTKYPDKSLYNDCEEFSLKDSSGSNAPSQNYIKL